MYDVCFQDYDHEYRVLDSYVNLEFAVRYIKVQTELFMSTPLFILEQGVVKYIAVGGKLFPLGNTEKFTYEDCEIKITEHSDRITVEIWTSNKELFEYGEGAYNYDFESYDDMYLIHESLSSILRDHELLKTEEYYEPEKMDPFFTVMKILKSTINTLYGGVDPAEIRVYKQ